MKEFFFGVLVLYAVLIATAVSVIIVASVASPPPCNHGTHKIVVIGSEYCRGN